MSLAELLETLTSCLPAGFAPYALWAAHRLTSLESAVLEGRRFQVLKLVRKAAVQLESVAAPCWGGGLCTACMAPCSLSLPLCGLLRSCAWTEDVCCSLERVATALCTAAKSWTASMPYRLGRPSP